MTTSFDSLPIVDLSPLSANKPYESDISALAQQLHDVFATTGFAYLINAPLSFSHDDVFSMAKEFFDLPEEEKMKLAKRTFREQNSNTYRGYFPLQLTSDNQKEGFEIGAPTPRSQALIAHPSIHKFHLTESNTWPPLPTFPSRPRAERLHTELQALSSRLLSLLAGPLGKPASHFLPYLHSSLSTLRFLHYPPLPTSSPAPPLPDLCCTPHTDSGLLTLLHQDATGGLEVLNASAVWVPAPYVPGSMVVNVGDLMAKVSGGRFVATVHRVRRTGTGTGTGSGRYSVPFFFEPGAACRVGSGDGGEEVVYGRHVLEKMEGWVEFQDVEKGEGVVERVVEVEMEAEPGA